MKVPSPPPIRLSGSVTDYTSEKPFPVIPVDDPDQLSREVREHLNQPFVPWLDPHTPLPPLVDPSPTVPVIPWSPLGVPVNEHGQWICGARLRNGGVHRRTVYYPGVRCPQHGGSVPRFLCWARMDDLGNCPVTVRRPGDRCPMHGGRMGERSRFPNDQEGRTVDLWILGAVMAISGIVGGLMSVAIVGAVERRLRRRGA